MKLSPQTQATLQRVCDQLIPRSMGMPSANDVDVAGSGFNRLAKVNKDGAESLVAMLDALGDRSVFELQDSDAGAFLGITSTISGIYLTDQEVMSRLGYEGRPPLPQPDYDAETAKQIELSEPVRSRGYIWKSTPQTKF